MVFYEIIIILVRRGNEKVSFALCGWHNPSAPPPTNADQLTNQLDHRVLRSRENGGPANDIVPTESTTHQRRPTSVALALGDALHTPVQS